MHCLIIIIYITKYIHDKWSDFIFGVFFNFIDSHNNLKHSLDNWQRDKFKFFNVAKLPEPITSASILNVLSFNNIPDNVIVSKLLQYCCLNFGKIELIPVSPIAVSN